MAPDQKGTKTLHRIPRVRRFSLVFLLSFIPTLSGTAPTYASPGALPQAVLRPPEQSADDGDDPPDAPLDRDRIAEAYVPPTGTVREPEGSVRVPVTLDRASRSPLTVWYTVDPGSARPDVHYQPVSGTLQFDGPSDRKADIVVPIYNNVFYSGPVTFTVRLVSQSTGSPLPDASRTVVTITDDEAVPSARIVAPNGGYTVGERAGAVAVTASVPYTTTSPLSIAYTTEDNTARAGVDYQAATGTAVIPSGQSSTTIPVAILDNGVLTGDRYFTIRLLNQSPGTLGVPASAQITVIDVQEPPEVQLSMPAFNVARDAGAASITATLSAPASVPVTVAYATADGTALAGLDYGPGAGTLTFAPGETEKAIPVPILDSGVYIGDRYFTLALTSPTEATLGEETVATILIRETNAMRLMLPAVLGRFDNFAENEPNGTLATAKGPLESGMTYRGGFDAAQVDQFGLDRDTWMIDVQVPGPVTVAVASLDSGRQVKLLNASGVDIPGGFSGDMGPTATFTVDVSAAGTYYVRVFSSAQLGANGYELQVTHP